MKAAEPRLPRTENESRRHWTLIAVCVTTFMLLLDITIVNVALPSIQRSLDADLTGLQWVVDAYALALAALILTAGALADPYATGIVGGQLLRHFRIAFDFGGERVAFAFREGR